MYRKKEKFLSNQFKENKLRQLQNEQLFYKYNDLLKGIFKDKDMEIEKTILILSISVKLNISIEEANRILMNYPIMVQEY